MLLLHVWYLVTLLTILGLKIVPCAPILFEGDDMGDDIAWDSPQRDSPQYLLYDKHPNQSPT
jgi:hypothetical protein